MNSELPGNFINRICTDNHGGFFICTNGGLVRYKGFFEPVSLGGTDNYHVNDAILDRGTLYVATTGRGLLLRQKGKWSVYEEKGNLFSKINSLCLVPRGNLSEPLLFAASPEGLFYLKNNTLIPYPDFPQISVNKIFFDNKLLWAGTENGIYTLNFSETENILPARIPVSNDMKSNNIKDVLVFDNRTWFATACGLARLYKDKFRIYDFLNSPIDSVDISSLSAGQKTLYLSGEKSIYTFINGLVDKLDIPQLTSPVRSIFVTSYRDTGADLWIGTAGQGLIRYNPDIKSAVISKTKTNALVMPPGDNKAVSYSVLDGLSSDTVKDIAVDNLSFYSNKLVWLAGDKGISMFDGKMFTNFNTENSGLSDNNVNVIKVNGPSGYRYLWAGTMTGGLCRFDGKNWKVYNRAEGLCGDTVFDIEFTKEGVWVATNFGAMFFNGEKWKHYTRENGLINDRVYDISFYSDSRSQAVWFSTELGVSSFIDNRFTSYSQWDGLKGFRFTRVLPLDLNTILIGSSRKGITLFNGRSFSDALSGKLTFDQVTDMAMRENNIFIACDKGIFKLKKNNFNSGPEKLEFDLKNKTPVCIETDGVYLWIGTNKGLLRFSTQ
jgi:ligand-binding sensor domain-containing protein